MNTKRNLLAVVTAGAIALGGFAIAQTENEVGGPGPGAHAWHHGGDPLEHMTKSLNLTADQQAKVKPILDQAKPQLQAIHQDAMTKAKAVMDNAMSQIRPLLTADQQAKADAMQKAHQDMRNAMKEMHDAASSTPSSK